MNSRLFSIGMFPWVCLAELPLFYDRSWPRLWMHMFKTDKMERVTKFPDKCKRKYSNTNLKFKQKFVVCLILLYCSSQVFLPYSHFITEGCNGWTNGIYGYSWDMMIHAWDTTLTVVEVVDRNNNGQHFLHPNAFSVNDRWTKHPDMAYQYAQCIQQNLVEDFLVNDQSRIGSQNISIYFDAWSSLNGRFQQRMFDPSVDMLSVEWSPFKSVHWMKPLLQQFTSKRTELLAITKDVLSWNNFTDVLFIADFPDQTVESYISKDLDNVTLTVLDGVVVYQTKYHDTLYTLKSGQSVNVVTGKFHKVTTTSRTPSCFMYTYENMTMKNTRAVSGETNKPFLPIWSEITNRVKNVKQFFFNIQNALLYELNGIPMPEREKVSFN